MTIGVGDLCRLKSVSFALAVFDWDTEKDRVGDLSRVVTEKGGRIDPGDLVAFLEFRAMPNKMYNDVFEHSYTFARVVTGVGGHVGWVRYDANEWEKVA